MLTRGCILGLYDDILLSCARIGFELKGFQALLAEGSTDCASLFNWLLLEPLILLLRFEPCGLLAAFDAKGREFESIVRPLFDDDDTPVAELPVNKNGEPDEIDELDELRAK